MDHPDGTCFGASAPAIAKCRKELWTLLLGLRSSTCLLLCPLLHASNESLEGLHSALLRSSNKTTYLILSPLPISHHWHARLASKLEGPDFGTLEHKATTTSHMFTSHYMVVTSPLLVSGPLTFFDIRINILLTIVLTILIGPLRQSSIRRLQFNSLFSRVSARTVRTTLPLESLLSPLSLQ